MSLEGKHALITGGSRGIGRGIALKLAESGVNVAINYVQNKTAASDTLAQVRERGADGFIVQADVSRPENIKEMLNRVESEFNALDIFQQRPSGAARVLQFTLRPYPGAVGHGHGQPSQSVLGRIP